MDLRRTFKDGKFLDMKISIHKDWVFTSLYEKSMNLYLYIPTHSAHPLGVLTVIVYGSILCIHLLCRDKDDINLHMKYFYARLLARCYQRDLLIPAFTKGITGAHAFIKRGSVR